MFSTEQFPITDEKSAFHLMVNLKYKDSLQCPSCKNTDIRFRVSRRKLICSSCLKEWSPFKNTIFQGSHLSLVIWLGIIWDLVNLKGPVTATRVTDRWELGSYSTGWYTLARIRKALATQNRNKIHGIMEMDDLVIRGISSEYRKTVILGALQFGIVQGQDEIEIPNLKLKLIKINNPDEMRMKNVLNRGFERSSKIYTDDRKLYLRNWLAMEQYNVRSSQKRGHPFIIRGILQDVEEHMRVDHGGIQDKYLQDYLDEAVFYFHHLQDKDRGFKALIEICLNTPPSKRSELFAPVEEKKLRIGRFTFPL
ncbi:MAG: hypothetical protein JEY99_09060 [Spirochaetales bacterium]|nr:hypothetical protein [Spirochaetales bacterium]